MVVDTIAFDAPKTKTMVQFLDALSLNGSRNLLIVDGNNRTLYPCRPKHTEP